MGIGLWPACPHGEPYGMHAFHPYWDEHVSSNGPVYVESLAQRRKLMKANNMDYAPVKRGMPRQEI